MEVEPGIPGVQGQPVIDQTQSFFFLFFFFKGGDRLEITYAAGKIKPVGKVPKKAEKWASKHKNLACHMRQLGQKLTF